MKEQGPHIQAWGFPGGAQRLPGRRGIGGAAAWIVVSVLMVLGHVNLPLPQQLSCWQERFEKQLQVRLFGCVDWEKDSRSSKAVPRLMVVSEERERGVFVAPLQVSQHISRHSLESTASFPPPLRVMVLRAVPALEDSAHGSTGPFHLGGDRCPH